MSEALTCDTSVLVPALVSWHPDHHATRAAMADVATIPGHVLVECYSVLTRLPAPHRLSAAVAGQVVETLGLSVVTLPADRHVEMLTTLAGAGVRGGAVYDALVGLTSAHHGLSLVTRDRRARATYDVVGARYHMV